MSATIRMEIMRIIRPILCLLILLICKNLSSQLVITIGEGTLLNVCLPVEPFNNYSYSQSIYDAEEIACAGIITSLGFQYRINGNIFLENTNQFSIYIGLVFRDEFTGNTDWVPLDSLQLVFQGSLQEGWFSSALPGQGWLTIPLDTPYAYANDANLVIAVDENMPGSSSSGDDFYCMATDSPKSIEIHSMTVNPDPASPPTAYPGNPLAIRPNLQLDFLVQMNTPHNPNPADEAVDIALTPTLSWESDMAMSYDVYFGTVGEFMQLWADDITTNSWTCPLLQMYTEYQWQIIANTPGPYPGPVWTFRTEGETLSPPLNLTGMAVGTHVQLAWQPPEQGTIVSYNILRNQQVIANCLETEYTDTGTIAGQTFWYQVEAVNYLNQLSPPSNTVSVTIPGEQNMLSQTFEQYDDFTQTIPGWTMYDLDGSDTWQFIYNDFPGEGLPMSWIVFNPQQVYPPLTTITPHGGQRMAVCMDSMNPPNNDWLISPQMGGYNRLLSFWARSMTSAFGLERMRVLVSTTDTLTTSFQPISDEPWISVPAVWTLYQFSLLPYGGLQIYLAWQCVSWDALALCLDDIVVESPIGNPDEVMPQTNLYRIYPNPARDYFKIESSAKLPFNLQIYNLKGQRVFEDRQLDSFDWNRNTDLNLPSGVYLLKISNAKSQLTRKILIW
jgi:hypothetical protein